ncbi:MAG: hypothetical protein IT196_25965 [Acidimicrobiales bacterium]|nr:hypothetical protein [Acidimicrobiales bacterium]
MSAQHRNPMAAVEELGWRIERDGIDALSPDELAAVADLAHEQHLSATLAQVLVDATAPRAARERAFGRLALQLTRHRGVHLILAA